MITQGLGRPRPPESVFEHPDRCFAAAPEVAAWLNETMLRAGAPLFNADHEHLQSAHLGILWTTEPNIRHMREIIGQAEKPGSGQGNKWSRARQRQQLTEWFGAEPDFVLTFSALFARGCSDIEWCALVEHELYHCGQQINEFGAPKFTKDGMPVFGIRGHDVEEFVGVVRRYGITAEPVRALVTAASTAPMVSVLDIQRGCGTCRD